MKTLRIYPSSINSNFIEEAAESLRRGSMMAYPTDTYYALGCAALNNGAIERLCRIKGVNPARETLSVVCADISQASEYAHIDNHAYAILRRYLPGPFTFILPISSRLPKVFKGRKQVGIRVPGNAIARALAAELGAPLLSTSITACIPEGETEVEPEVVAAYLEESGHDIGLMIDGGAGLCQGSTVVDLTDSRAPQIIRQGIGVFND